MSLITARARAYVNFGRWVADCPAGCGSARQLDPHEEVFHCNECRTITPIEWPPDPQGIWDALDERRFPKNRNWYPSGHDIALKIGAPHGQTADELRAETRLYQNEADQIPAGATDYASAKSIDFARAVREFERGD